MVWCCSARFSKLVEAIVTRLQLLWHIYTEGHAALPGLSKSRFIDLMDHRGVRRRTPGP